VGLYLDLEAAAHPAQQPRATRVHLPVRAARPRQRVHAAGPADLSRLHHRRSRRDVQLDDISRGRPHRGRPHRGTLPPTLRGAAGLGRAGRSVLVGVSRLGGHGGRRSARRSSPIHSRPRSGSGIGRACSMHSAAQRPTSRGCPATSGRSAISCHRLSSSEPSPAN
jgi:hypothetical protein